MDGDRRRHLELAVAVRRGLIPLDRARRALESGPPTARPPAPDLRGSEPGGDDPVSALDSAARAAVKGEAERLGSDPSASAAVLAALEAQVGAPLGQGKHYSVRRELARGGMGRILVALDSHIGREVAYKELLRPAPGTPATQAGPAISTVDIGRERFLREARVTGQLEHPNIVPVYEIGEDGSGGLFYTMKLVHGRTLSERILEIQLDLAKSREEKLTDRLKLLDAFVDVCHAAAYAHARGVINRDLKPANVMLGDFGETLVLDWGLARASGQEDVVCGSGGAGAVTSGAGDSAMLTMTGQVIGTPLYMPPEQARGDLANVTERSDIYSLGAILYEIVTGFPPYDEIDPQEVLARVRTTPPVPVLQREPRAPRELVAIIERAMAREPGRRLDSAKRLAEEVLAFRDGRALTVYRYSLAEQVARFAKRNRALASAAGIAFLALGAALSVALAYGAIAKDESVAAGEARDRAQKAEAEARSREAAERAAREEAQKAYRTAEGQRLATIAKTLVAENPGQALLLALEAHARAPGLQANNALLAALEALTERKRFGFHDGYLTVAEFSPDEKRILTAGDDHTARVWEAATGNELGRFERRHRGPVARAEWSPDGKRVMTLSAGKVRVWDAARFDAPALEFEGAAADAAFASDGAVLVAADRACLVQWELTGHLADVNFIMDAPAVWVRSAGRRAAALSRNGRAFVWDGGLEPRWEEDLGAGAGPAALSADGSRVVFASADGVLLVRSMRDGRLARLQSPRPIHRVALSADGRILVVHDAGGFGAAWNLETGARGREFPLYNDEFAFCLSGDGRLMARTRSSDVLVEETMTGAPVSRHSGHEYAPSALRFSRDASLLLSASRDRTAALWNVQAGTALAAPVPDFGATVAAMRADAARAIVSAGDPAVVELRDAAGRALCSLGTHPLGGFQAVFDDTGLRALCRAFDRNDAQLLNAETAQLIATLVGADAGVSRAAFAPGGGFVALASPKGLVQVFSTADGNETARFPVPGLGETESTFLSALAVSSDGRRVAVGHGQESVLSVWDTAAGRELGRLNGHTGFILGAAFTPDLFRLVTTAADASARVWDAATLQQTGYFRWPRIDETYAAISPDGRWFAMTGAGEARLIQTDRCVESVTLSFPAGVAGASFRDARTLLVRLRDSTWRAVPVDLASTAAAVAPREPWASDLSRFEVGPPEERRLRIADFEKRRPSLSQRLGRGRAALRGGRHDEALQHFRDGAAILPFHPEPPFWIAVALCARNAPGDLAAAFASAREACDRGFGEPKEMKDLKELEPLKSLPEFVEWAR
jgi:serine/threonine protein kinase/WD40 repeat protein